MDDGELLRYALRRRNYLVAMWLTLQQRWFVKSFNASARVLSWAIVSLGMALVTATVVTLARNVVPVLTTPGTVSYYLLELLVLIVSFNIYVNYLCATAFSRRIGKAPADYVYHDPYAASHDAVPRDDSELTEDEGSSDDDNADAADEQEMRERRVDSTRGGGGVTAAPAGAAAAVPAASPTPRSHGSADGMTRRGGPPMSAASTAAPSPLPHPSLADVQVEMSPLPRCSTASSTLPVLQQPTLAGIRVVRVFGAPAGGAVEPEDGEPAAVDVPLRAPRARRGVRWHVTSCARAAVAFVGRLGCARMAALCRPCDAAVSSLQRVAPEARLETLRELEQIAAVSERYPPRLRAARVLDMPRRYCQHCRRLKAPREHHCAICGECVTKMDHHCPWINNCVDAENQRYFLLFVWWLWLGTLLATSFGGYGYARETRYAREVTRLHAKWRAAADKAAVEAELRALTMPYGPSGVLLTSFPTVLTLGMAVIIFFCMSLFLYFNRRLVMENTTVIEGIYVDDKRKHTYRSTSFLYRSPYDLGAWLNFIDLFAPAGDPVVRAELKAEAAAAAPDAGSSPRSSGGDVADGGATPRRPWRGAMPCWLRRALVVAWLAAFPTFRPIYGDGVHYPTFDALAAGQPHPLMAG